MIITLVKKEKGHEVIKKFTKKYESIKELERLYKETGNNLFLVDLENWKYLKENPDEEIERGEIKITNKLILTESELEILDFIKNEKPKSIRELARFLNKDIKIIHPKIKELEQIGLIELKEGIKNTIIPSLNFDEISISI
jgi:DNA-binding Lrp family transcriptional regulator